MANTRYRLISTPISLPILNRIEAINQTYDIYNNLYLSFRSTAFKDDDNNMYLTLDKQFYYDSITHDFGPPCISQIYRFCKMLETKLLDATQNKKKLIFWMNPVNAQASHIKPNVCVYLGAFLILSKHLSADEAWLPFSNMRIILDASNLPSCNYKMTVYHCLQAIYRGKQEGIFTLQTFNCDEFEMLNAPENGDVSIILAGKLYAFPGPTTSTYETRFQSRLSPSHYVPIFRKLNISCIVRLNEKCYPATSFTHQGFRHVELSFTDGSAPPFSIAKQFLEVASGESGVAIHCKAGLGRTGTLIALYFIYYLRWSAPEVMAWVRLARPGSIMGVQHLFLMQMEDVIFNRLRDVPKELKFFTKNNASRDEAKHDENEERRLELKMVEEAKVQVLSNVNRNLNSRDATMTFSKMNSGISGQVSLFQNKNLTIPALFNNIQTTPSSTSSFKPTVNDIKLNNNLPILISPAKISPMPSVKPKTPLIVPISPAKIIGSSKLYKSVHSNSRIGILLTNK